MKIFSQSTASGTEWKPCIACGRVFECGEIITSLSSDSDCDVMYWYCCLCLEWFWAGGALADRGYWADPEYIDDRFDRLVELEQFKNYARYVPYYRLESCSQN